MSTKKRPNQMIGAAHVSNEKRLQEREKAPGALEVFLSNALNYGSSSAIYSEYEMNNSYRSFVGCLGLIFTVFTAGCDTTDWRYHFQNVELEAFGFRSTDDKKISYELADTELVSLSEELSIDALPFGVTASKAVLRHVDCQFKFKDGKTLRCEASLHFYKGKTFISISYPSDEGFPAGPSMFVQLDNCIEPENLAVLRKAFLGNTKPPPWEKMFHKGKLLPDKAKALRKKVTV